MHEFDLIAAFFGSALTASHSNVVVPNGDDAAVLALNGQQVICSDTLVSDVHFFANESPTAIGWKSVAVNLSDLAAMGATPHSIVLNISLPNVDTRWLADFSLGLSSICQQYNVQLIGGDTTRSNTLVISVTAIGTLNAQQLPIRRSGAQPGDVIAVTGTIGGAAYALRHYTRLKQCSNPAATQLLTQLTQPEPQVALGAALVGIATSMIDISDGLVQDLSHLVQASNVSAQLHLHLLPLEPAIAQDKQQQHTTNQKFNTQDAIDAATGGDDYQLCCTLSESAFNTFNHNFSRKGLPALTKVGTIVASNHTQPTVNTFWQQQPVTIATAGFKHF